MRAGLLLLCQDKHCPAHQAACSRLNKGSKFLLWNFAYRRVIKDTGRLLLIFFIGSIATVCGTLVALKMLPLRSLGADGWKVRGCKLQLLT